MTSRADAFLASAVRSKREILLFRDDELVVPETSPKLEKSDGPAKGLSSVFLAFIEKAAEAHLISHVTVSRQRSRNNLEFHDAHPELRES